MGHGRSLLTQEIDVEGNKFEYVMNAGDTYVDETRVSESNGAGGFNLVRTVSQTYQDHHLRTRTVQVRPGVTHTESWEYVGQWLKAYQVVQDDLPDRVFRTEYTFYRNGLREGQPGYSATAPITNVYEIRRATAASGGVATAFETTTLEYDQFGRLTRVTPPALASNPDSFAIVRTYYDLTEANVGARGMLAGIHLEAGIPTAAPLPELQQSFTYDARGRVASVTDARGHTTTYGWDDRGRLESLTNDLPAPETLLLTYGAPNASNPENAQPGDYLVRIERGQTVSPPQPGRVERLLWDARDFLTGVQRLNESSAFETFATYTHDSDGNRVREIDGTGEVHSATYDELGRMLTSSDHTALWSGTPPALLHTTTFAYDAFGNRRKVTDDKGRVTDFAFDGRDRLVSVTQQGNGDAPQLPEPLVTGFEYDAAGNVTKVTDPKSQATIYGYDLLSRLRTVTQPLLEVVAYDYDARSRLSKTTNARGQALLYGYFAFGGLKDVVYDLDNDGEDAGERKVSYTYDENGNALTLRDTAVSWVTGGLVESFTYDALDRVDTATAHYIEGAPLLDARYDHFGNRDELTLADGGAPLRHQWSYDKLNRLAAACLPPDATTAPCVDGGATQTLDFTYLANDRLDLLTHGNGLVTDIDYHPYGPIHQIVVGSSPFPQKLVYSYDELLNVDTISETQNGVVRSPDFDFAYDAVYRLAEADYPTGLDLPPAPGESFGYDKAGNRDDNPSSATPWAYDANNRLTKSPGLSARCDDADGNQTTTRSSGDCSTGTVAETYGWDASNRLTSFSKSGTSAAYLYDPYGRRIKKTVNGTQTFYLWDGDRLLAEYDASGSRQVRYAYAEGFAPVQVAYAGSPEVIYDVHSDHLDTPRMLTDSSGTAVWRANYEAFGTTHVSSDPDGSSVTPDPDIDFNIRFPGQFYDAESGLHYNRFRYYDASTGRYVSADPIGQFGLLAIAGVASSRSPLVPQRPWTAEIPVWAFDYNSYDYAVSSPTRLIDPTGELVPLIGAAVGGLTAASAAADAGLTGWKFAAAVAGGAALGAVSGGIFTAYVGTGFIGTTVSATLTGGLTGAGADAFTQALDPHRSICWGSVASSAKQGAVVAGFSAALGLATAGAFPGVAGIAPWLETGAASAVSLHLSTNSGGPRPLPVSW